VAILTVIPARSGSKRVPGKNSKIISGKPLIAHTIIAAQKAGCCGEIVVSTDSQEIADIALKYNAIVPCLRPSNLSQDESDVMHAIIHMIELYNKKNIHFDSVLLLQPTSLFRKSDTIRKAVELHELSGLSVVSVNPISLKHSWYKSIDITGNLDTPELFRNAQSDDLSEDLYILNGAIYITTIEQLLVNQSFYGNPTKAFLMDASSECLDIDTWQDWALAEKLIESKKEVL